MHIQLVPDIRCEAGLAQGLAGLATSLGMHRPLVLSDAQLLQQLLVQSAVVTLRQTFPHLALFSDVLADPPEQVVAAAVALAIEQRCDGVIGLGGGSSMDCAKLVALLARTPQPLAGIYGIGLARGPRWPLIQVPTTAGTGAEVTPVAIVTTAAGDKKGVVSELLLADMAVLDAELTLALPPALTAMVGMDAIVHAIEAFTSRLKKNPVSDAFAVDALRLLVGSIETAVRDGQDRAAREAMLMGACLAGLAFANAPVGAVHALAYPLGAHFKVAHGLSNALVLPAVLRFNLKVAGALYADLARRALGLSGPDERLAPAFVDHISALSRRMPYAQRMADVGVAAQDLATLADGAMEVQRLLVNNPRALSRAEALDIYWACL